MLGSSLVRGSQESKNAHLVEEPRKAKVYWLFSRETKNQFFPRSWLPLSGELAPQATNARNRIAWSTNKPLSDEGGGKTKRERDKSLKDAVKPLSLSLANARQLPHQREPREAEYVLIKEEIITDNKLSLMGTICDRLEHKQFFLRSWLPLSGELAPQATEG